MTTTQHAFFSAYLDKTALDGQQNSDSIVDLFSSLHKQQDSIYDDMRERASRGKKVIGNLGAAGTGALAAGTGSVGMDMMEGKSPDIRRAFLAAILIGAPVGAVANYLGQKVDQRLNPGPPRSEADTREHYVNQANKRKTDLAEARKIDKMYKATNLVP